MKRIRFLTLKQVCNIHDKAVRDTGGLGGLRDKGLLDSAINYPRMLHDFGQSNNICDMAAAYGHRIIKNHAFIDGNKRTGVLMISLRISKNMCAKSPKNVKK